MEANTINDTLKKIIADRFKFETLSIHANAGGFSAENFFLHCDGNGFLLKCYRSKDEGKIRHLDKTTLFLQKQGFPIPLSIHGADGEGYFSHDGNFYGLFPRIYGHTQHEHNLSDKALYCAGHCLALFHSLDNTQDISINGSSCLIPETITEDSILLAVAKNPVNEQTDAITRDLINIKRRIIEKFSSNMQNYCPEKVLIHGDYHNQNLLFGMDNEIIGLLDFELVRHDDPLVDIMSFIHLACCNSGYKSANIQKAKIFLDGYRSLRVLTVASLRYGMINSMIRMARSLFIEAKIYIDGHHDLSMLISRDYTRLLFLSANFESIVEKL